MDDPIAEAGFAMEKHIFGGIIGPSKTPFRQAVFVESSGWDLP